MDSKIMDKKVKQLFANGNRSTSDNELLLTFQCASGASNAKEFEELLDAALAPLSGVAKLNEDDGRDLIGRTYNVLANLHKAQLRSNCMEVLSRFGDDPTAVVETLGDFVKRLLEPKAKSRKPKKDEDESDGEEAAKADAEEPKEPKKAAKAEEEPKEPKKAAKAETPKEEVKPRVPVVLPKKSGLPKPEY